MTDAKPTTDLDPAAVAAASTAAAALLGASSDVTPAPDGSLPVVPKPPPLPPTSRYSSVGTAVHEAGDQDIVHLRRRLVPRPELLATAGWEEFGVGDRIDLVAGRALTEPASFWQLCDANGVEAASELEQPGRRVRLGLPQGFPGVTGD